MSLNLLTTYDKQIFEQLEWPKLMAPLSNLAYFSINKQRFLNFTNRIQKEQINIEYDKLEHFQNLKHSDNTQLLNKVLLLDNNFDFSQVKRKIKKSQWLDTTDYFKIASFIKFIIFVSKNKNLNIWNLNFNELNSDFKRTFLDEVFTLFKQDGSINYTGHKRLRPLYLKNQNIEESIRSQLKHLLHSDLYKDVLQFEQWDIINDKYVLPVSSDRYTHKLGMITSHSSTGQTVFVEPTILKQLNSERQETSNLMASIIFKICNQLSKSLFDNYSSLNNIFDITIEIDHLIARVEYCKKHNLHRPIFNNNSETTFENIFHPLIDSSVKNTISIDRTMGGLTISGPNTGGKTVLLKSICLNLLFPFYGLYSPSSYSSFKIPDSIYYYSNDLQSISNGLSSFSAESLFYLKAFQEGKGNTYYIIDEIYNSTSSEEASSLAFSFLEILFNRQDTNCFVTTHHQLLKSLIHQSGMYLSAHMGFNEATYEPTYKCNIGTPGSSYAIQIFSKLEEDILSDNSITQKSFNYNKQDQISYEKLLGELSEKIALQDALNYELETKILQLNNKEKSLKGLFEIEKLELIGNINTKAKKIIDEAFSLRDQVKRKDIRSLNTIAQKSFSIKQSIEELNVEKQTSQPNAHVSIALENISVGDLYLWKKTNQIIEVIKINHRKKQVQIIYKKIKSWVAISELTSTTQRNVQNKNGRVKVYLNVETKGHLELDCRGFRLGEFEQYVTPSIYEVLNGEIPHLIVIHGHGNGHLKKWLRDYLKTFSDLSWDNADGNDGCTRISLRV